jgi:hypothetical protein
MTRIESLRSAVMMKKRFPCVFTDTARRLNLTPDALYAFGMGAELPEPTIRALGRLLDPESDDD